MQSANALDQPQFSADKWNKVGLVKTSQLAADCYYLRAGQAHRWHRHPDADKVVMVLQGIGELLVDTGPSPERTDLRPGVVVLVPRGAWHRMAATGSDLVAVSATRFPCAVEEK